ncbi:prepilin peptidase [Nocardioides sp. MAH-18]|uniref:Prepilin peptidase n=1 Tax=Nocardioides agri TaxID=2682843 RepID=A0A6L6XZ11_9ACTN|nr:A24 family peptidase [Nocardioides sp. MAH-18]MBA2952735.1 prepilin peptidase [Nocardioides sp. CGMCC 1.13656]MVQ51897.1 prepilin peptidase [Nocardioides sp. MAH-18]
MTLAVVTLTGVLGLVVGSFLNVVAHRVPRGESVVRPPSACPQCHTVIRTRHNIPVLGWLVLRGRCYDCGLPISVRYPTVEAATGVLFALAGLRFADQPTLLVAYLAFAGIAVALAVIDLDVHRLPNVIVLPSYPVLGVLLALGVGGAGLLRAGVGAALLFAFFYVVAIVAPGGIGFGDVKLAGVVGGMTAAVSWGAFLTSALGGFFLGAVAGVLLMLGRRASRKTAVPFGPFMLLGAWASILGASGIGQLYLERMAMS